MMVSLYNPGLIRMPYVLCKSGHCYEIRDLLKYINSTEYPMHLCTICKESSEAIYGPVFNKNLRNLNNYLVLRNYYNKNNPDNKILPEELLD